MKLYIPPHDLARYWWRTRQSFHLDQHQLAPRWSELDGTLPAHNHLGVFFTACDSIYFDQYAENYISSIATSGGGQSVHIHVYNGDDERLAHAVRFGCERGVRVSATRDVRPDAALYSAFLFAAGRFVILPLVLRACASPLICTDIDVLIRGSFDRSIELLCESDVSLHLRPASSLPWRKVLASTVIAMPTGSSQHFFGCVAETLADILRLPVRHHVDQIILFWAYRQGRAAGRHTVRFASMDKRLIDWDFGRASLMWNAKGPERKPAYWDAVNAAQHCRGTSAGE